MKNISLKYRNYKIVAAVFILVVFCSLSSMRVDAQDEADNPNNIYLHMFYGQGCPHCSSLKLFLNDMANKYPSLKIYEHEVYQNNEGRKLFEKLADKFSTEIGGGSDNFY